MDLSAALLERDHELTMLDAVLSGAEEGRGAIVRVRAPAGLGKSRLLSTAASIGGERGFLALGAAGSELEREFGFGVARQLFARPIQDASRDLRAELVAEPAGLAAPLLGIGEQLDRPLSPVETGDLFRALYWLTVRLADQRPLLLAVDDLHLADPASLGFIAYLAGRVEDSPVVVLVAQRSGEPMSTAVETALADRAREIELAPLSAAATAQLAAIALGVEIDATVGAACWRATEGNPMLLHELLTTLRIEGVDLVPGQADRVAAHDSTELARAGVLRLALLSERERRLAAAIAGLDGKADFPVVARLAGMDIDEASAGVSDLRSLGIAAPDEPVRVVHALVRDAILGELAAAERSRLARSAAAVLAEAGADEERVAGHLVATAPAKDPWVVAQLRSAARSAMARGARAEAATLLERASREGTTGELQGRVLAELGQAMYTATPAKAPDVFLSASRLLTDPGERVGCHVLAARCLVVSGDVPRAVAVLQEAIDVHALDGDEAERVLLEAEATGMARLDTRLRRRALDGIERLERELPDEGPVRRIVLAVIAAERSYQARPAGELRPLALEALGDGSLLDELGPESPPFYGAAFALLLADDAAGCVAQFDAALAHSPSHSSIAAVPRGCRAIALLRLGRPAEAEVEARLALDILIEREESLLVPLTAAALVDALLLRGAVDEARDVLALAAPAHDGEPSTSLASHFLVRRAKLAIADGDDGAALALLLSAGVEEQAVGCTNPGATEWRAEAAIVALRLGRADRARDLAESNLRDANAIGGPRVRGIAERVQALVGPTAERETRLARSAALLEEAGDGVQRALSLVELGAAQLHAGAREAGRASLGKALDLAMRCGASAVADRAGEAYERAGGRARRHGASLTPTERHVCELAAAGATTDAIAQALMLTRRAVEDHLERAYRKLAVQGRAELAGALATLG